MRESSQQVFGQAIDNLFFFFFLFTVQPRKAFIWKYKSERFQYFQIVRSSFHRKPKAVDKERKKRQSRKGRVNDYIVSRTWPRFNDSSQMIYLPRKFHIFENERMIRKKKYRSLLSAINLIESSHRILKS